MRKIVIALTSLLVLASCKEKSKENTEAQEKGQTAMNGDSEMAETHFDLTPIEHATAVFTIDSTVFYIDPVGGADAFEGQPVPNVILVTDIHGDHLNAETLSAVMTDGTTLIAPQAVVDQLEEPLRSKAQVLANGNSMDAVGIKIFAVPMYNLREEAKQFHTKGRGNGYVVEKGDLRVYFSGDTEDIPEMRELKNIDKAFVCMNLPYTMTVESAADGVVAFAPKEVYPYHYRGQDGKSDVAKFKSLVNSGNPEIKVVQLDWYAE